MATSAIVSVSEYLRTAYRPDCDYVDGQVLERNLGELDHSILQRQFLRLLWTTECERFFSVYQELRVQVSATRFRVPDVCLLAVSAPREQIIVTPPILCIEVLSPEDTIPRTRTRAQDFLNMGVPEVWIVDPVTRVVILCDGATMTEQKTGEVAVPGTPITLAIADIFGVLDEK